MKADSIETRWADVPAWTDAEIPALPEEEVIPVDVATGAYLRREEKDMKNENINEKRMGLEQFEKQMSDPAFREEIFAAYEAKRFEDARSNELPLIDVKDMRSSYDGREVAIVGRFVDHTAYQERGDGHRPVVTYEVPGDGNIWAVARFEDLQGGRIEVTLGTDWYKRFWVLLNEDDPVIVRGCVFHFEGEFELLAFDGERLIDAYRRAVSADAKVGNGR